MVHPHNIISLLVSWKSQALRKKNRRRGTAKNKNVLFPPHQNSYVFFGSGMDIIRPAR